MRYPARHLLGLSCSLLAAVLIVTAAVAANRPEASPVAATIAEVQPKIVKIYGAGGLRGMEGYQSGMLISPDGHVLTVFSYVLDTESITVTLYDGRRFDAALLGADPRLEIAVLKIDTGDLPYFDLQQAVDAGSGTRVLAFSNAFGVATGNEPASVQHGIIAVVTTLDARRGVFETLYRGPVYVLDAITNNPGAAGGALVTRRGQLLAILGKELRSALNDTWLNYGVPIAQLRRPIDNVLAGLETQQSQPERKMPAKSLTLEMLGLVLVPDVLDRTPPYVDQVRPGSPAARAGIRPDDLILMLGQQLIQSCKSLRAELKYIDFEDEITLTVLREPELLEIPLQTSVEQDQQSP